MPKYVIPIEIEIRGGNRAQWERYIDGLGLAISNAVEEYAINDPPPFGDYFVDVRNKYQEMTTSKPKRQSGNAEGQGCDAK